MVRVPTIAEEDAKRPNRERECLVKERTRFVNRMKGTLARLGIRNFRPTLRNAAERLAALSTPEGSPLPRISPQAPRLLLCARRQDVAAGHHVVTAGHVADVSARLADEEEPGGDVPGRGGNRSSCPFADLW
jgi:transposase